MAETPRRDGALLLDMLLAARDAQGFIEGSTRHVSSRAGFIRTSRSVRWRIIGEAAGKISAAVQTAHPEISWREITGMRHRLIHGYGDVRLDLIWAILHEHVPALIAALEKLTPPEK